MSSVKRKPSIKVIAFESDQYSKEMLKLLVLASEKYQRIFYCAPLKTSKEIVGGWKKSKIYPERFRIFGAEFFGKTGLCAKLEKTFKQEVELDFSDLVIFDSISDFKGGAYSSLGNVLGVLLLRALKRKISCVMPIFKDDINSKPISSVSKFVDNLIDWEEPEINKFILELRNLTDKLLGSESTGIMIGASEGESVSSLLNQYEEVMATILGPENTEKQLSEIKDNYTGEII